MEPAATIATLRAKYQLLSASLSERTRRHWAAVEAIVLPRDGLSLVAEATGLPRSIIKKEIRELRKRSPTPENGTARGCRRPGSGRHPAEFEDATLIADLDRLIDPGPPGAGTAALRWTCQSTRQLAAALRLRGHDVSHQTVARLLHHHGYSLLANRKTREGGLHHDCNAQFAFIHRRVQAFQLAGQPVVSVETRKKIGPGLFRHPDAPEQPEEVQARDVASRRPAQAVLSGEYDLTCHEGWLVAGIDHDTARFAVETVRCCWLDLGKLDYPRAQRLLIAAVGAVSNGHRNRSWKMALQELADETGLKISVCHFPPGTSKWSTIEHRMFCHVIQSGRDRPLAGRAVIVNLLGTTETPARSIVPAALEEDERMPWGNGTDEDLAGVWIRRNAFHGEWNYTIVPQHCLGRVSG